MRVRFPVSLFCVSLAASAYAGVPAVEVSTDFSPSVGRDIDESNRIYVEGPDDSDGRPWGEILLPPHPGGEQLVLPCSWIEEYPPCFHEYDVPGGFAESGRIVGRRVTFGSGGPFVPYPMTWSADGTVGTDLLGFDEGLYPYEGHVAHGNSGEVFVGFVPRQIPSAELVPVYWSGPADEPIELENLGYVSPEKGPYPARISDAGEIVGTTEGSGQRAAIWKPPAYALEFLGELPGGATSRAHDVDEGSRVVGSSDDGSGDVAVIWSANGSGYDVTPLPLPAGFEGGSCTEATAVSDAGRIAGNCTTAGGQTRGIIWRKQEASWVFDVDLDPLAGDTESAVFGLNENGQAVGRSGDEASGRAVLWNFAVPAPVPSLSAPALLGLGLWVLWMGRRALGRSTLRAP